jgi:calcineurin-like phosphoesterase family protein
MNRQLSTALALDGSTSQPIRTLSGSLDGLTGQKEMNVTPDTWIISDTHFGHRNIIKFCDRPKDSDWLIESNWVDVVGPDDDILHLGDVMVWYNDEWMDVAKTTLANLPGNKYFIRGNHDKMSAKEFAALGWTEVDEFTADFDIRILFSHYPDHYRVGFWDANIHGHIHNSPYDPKYSLYGDYRNVSVEVMNYRPWKFSDIMAGQYQSRKVAGTWDESQDDRKIVMPTEKELDYYGNR